MRGYSSREPLLSFDLQVNKGYEATDFNINQSMGNWGQGSQFLSQFQDKFIKESELIWTKLLICINSWWISHTHIPTLTRAHTFTIKYICAQPLTPTHTHAYLHTHIYTRAHPRTPTHTHANVCIPPYTCTHTAHPHTPVHISAHPHTFAHTHTYLCTFANTCTYPHPPTHTCTHSCIPCICVHISVHLHTPSYTRAYPLRL